MNKEEIAKKLMEGVPESIIRIDEPMQEHTSFKIGGAADIFVTPNTKEQIIFIIDICKKYSVPYFILGNGSNLLVKDGGYRGVIIQIFKNMNNVTIEDDKVYAQSGALLVKVANEALDKSLEGFEFAHGIPGTVGGAVYMNAGAYGGEIKHVLIYADVLDKDGNLKRLSNEELELGYRTSRVQTDNMIVLGACFQLRKGNYNTIKEKMQDLAHRRRTKQPLTMPSAGSTFKRPPGYFAGKLIMDSDLRGCRIGDAAVSEKHCGFIVNLGCATAKDVIELIEHIRETVKDKFCVELHPELKIIGED